MPYEDMDAMIWNEVIYEDTMDDWEENEELLSEPELEFDEEEYDDFDDSVDESYYNPYLGCEDWDL